MPLSTHARLGSFFELCNFYFCRCQIAFSMKDKMSRSKRASGTQSRQDAEQSKKDEVGYVDFFTLNVIVKYLRQHVGYFMLP